MTGHNPKPIKKCLDCGLETTIGFRCESCKKKLKVKRKNETK